MQRIREQLRKRRIRGSYKKRMFLFLILLVYVPLILVGGISGRLYAVETADRKDAMLKSTEESVYYQVENILSSMKQYYINLNEDKTIKSLLQEKETPYRQYTKLKEAQQLLNGSYYLSNYVSDYYFINLRSDKPWILGKKGMYELDTADNQEEIEEFLASQKNEWVTIYWNNAGETPSSGLKPSKSVDLTGEQLVMRLGGRRDREDGYIIMKLDLSRIKKLFPGNSEDYEICIYDRDYKLITCTNKSLGSFLEKNESLFFNGEIRLPEEDGKYQIRINRESQNGLIYVTAYDMGDVQQGMMHILIGTSAVIIILTLILLVLWFSVSKLYQPVNDLVKFAEKLFEGEKEEDEFAYIQKEVKNLSSQHENLKQVVQQQRVLLRKSFLVNLIRGKLQEDVVSSNIIKFKLEECKHYGLVAVDYILETGRIEIENENYEIEMLNSMVVENLAEEIQEQLFLPPVSYGEKLLLIIGADTEETLHEKIELLHANLTAHIQRIYGCLISVGVSQIYSRLTMTRTAYHECMEALHSCRTTEGNQSYGIVFWEEFGGSRVSKDGYDTILEKSLTKAIDNCDKVETDYLLKQILEKMDSAQLASYDYMLGLHRLITSIYTVAYNAGIPVDGVLQQGKWSSLSAVFEQLDTIYNKERLLTVIETTITEPLINTLMEYRGSNSSDLLCKITRMIQEAKGDITLQECADRLSYHPSYIWKVLKTEKNTTFTELANLEKMRVAKELLSGTTDSIVDIAEKLHYSNVQNFSRFFSKYEQMTPGNWRKSHK